MNIMSKVSYQLSIIILLAFSAFNLKAGVVDSTWSRTQEHNKDSLNNAIPKCPDTKFSFYSYLDATSVIIYWDDMPAVKGQLEYQVRYRSQNSNGGWKIVDVDKGLSITIDELKNGLLYSFEIRKICYQ